MKKSNKKIMLIPIVVIVLGFLIILGSQMFKSKSYAYTAANNRTANTVYKDFNSVSSIENKYSSSILFFSKDSQIIHISGVEAGSHDDVEAEVRTQYVSNDPNEPAIQWPESYILTKTTDTLKILITKSAVDTKGNMLDTVISLSNVELWNDLKVEGSKDPYVKLTFDTYYEFLESQLNYEKEYAGVSGSGSIEVNTNNDVSPIKIGDPIRFWLHAEKASVDFELTYYKSGTVNQTTGVGTLADRITGINTFFSDIDITTSNKNNDEINRSNLGNHFLNANEGIAPLTGASTIYYNQSGTVPSGKINHITLSPMDDGIAIEASNIGYHNPVDANGDSGKNDNYYNMNAVWYQDSAFMTTDTTTSSLKFKYGGANCGIAFMFISPYPYTIPDPVKSIVENKIIFKVGESFHYKVTQYIPNNYYGELIDFNEIYPNIPETTHYQSFSLSDDIDSRLTILDTSLGGSPIKVVNENNDDKSSWFDITVSGQKVTATAKSTTLELSNFYAHTYSLIIPIKTTQSAVNVGNINNVGVSTIDNSPKNTNEVSISVYEKVANLYLVDRETDEHLSGGVLVVYDENDEIVAKWTTNENDLVCNLEIVQQKNGCEVYKELQPNKNYTIKEETTPIGYATEFNIDPFPTDEYGSSVPHDIIVKNSPIKVCISVVDESDKPISGMGVEMKSSNDTYKYKSTTEEECFDHVPVDKYDLDEVEVIDNYEKQEKQNIEVLNTPKVQRFKIVNQLKVPKTNIDSSKIIAIVSLIFAIFGISIFLVVRLKKQTN